jgi:hypothetical protein
MREPHPRNVAGDFYVENGCCTICGIPRAVAPDLCEVDHDAEHCFVSKQPGTPAELDQMVEAIRCSEFACIRYRGADLATQFRIVDLAEGDVCDALLPQLVRRNTELKPALRRRALLQHWKRRIAELLGTTRSSR